MIYANHLLGVQNEPHDASYAVTRLVGAVETGMPPAAAPPLCPVETAIFLCVDAALAHAAQSNMGPTKCARTFYVLLAAIAYAYNWVSTDARPVLEGTTDGWVWDVRYPIADPMLVYVWMNCVLSAIMPTFAPDANIAGTLFALEKATLGWTAEQQIEQHTAVCSAGHWTVFNALLQKWIDERMADGNAAAAAPPATSALPNGATVLDVAGDVNPTTFPQPDKWTPLAIGPRTQSYLTYGWGDVRAPVLTDEEYAAIAATANAAFPSPATRTAEIAEVVRITADLTDAQKMSAEFWAGGPTTVSPPGMFVWFWRTFCAARSAKAHTIIYSGYALATELFEVSRVVWGLKREHMQARPIQEIRAAYYGEMLTGYDGAPVRGEHWIPYQEANFVTPPFADFPSGHSAFSQVFALVMSAWFGAAIPADTTITATAADLRRISPLFTGASADVAIPFGEFMVPAGASRIQPAIVPAAPAVLRWSTWQEMADDAGISRKYGGIHATSAHVGSQAAARALHAAIDGRVGATLRASAATANAVQN
jgi:membrane-associated phospholipid phosphatase